AFRELPREELRFAGIRRSDLKALRDEKTCDRWIVVTSIFQPSPATRKLGELTKQGWCYVVVADKNGPKDYDDVEGVTYLTVERQRALHFHIMDHLPWRHFGRKNVGFLYAIAHGAKIIYDTDDDNRLKEARIPILGLDDLGREDGLAINVSRPDVETLGHGLQLVVNSGMVVYTVGVCCFSVGLFSQVLHTAKYASFRNAGVQSAKMKSMCTNIRALGHASDSGADHNLFFFSARAGRCPS
ncbi:STL1, partial [Symbiodinium necroappetens]